MAKIISGWASALRVICLIHQRYHGSPNIWSWPARRNYVPKCPQNTRTTPAQIYADIKLPVHVPGLHIIRKLCVELKNTTQLKLSNTYTVSVDIDINTMRVKLLPGQRGQSQRIHHDIINFAHHDATLTRLSTNNNNFLCYKLVRRLFE